jgi:hypothetical protein
MSGENAKLYNARQIKSIRPPRANELYLVACKSIRWGRRPVGGKCLSSDVLVVSVLVVDGKRLIPIGFVVAIERYMCKMRTNPFVRLVTLSLTGVRQVDQLDPRSPDITSRSDAIYIHDRIAFVTSV